MAAPATPIFNSLSREQQITIDIVLSQDNNNRIPKERARWWSLMGIVSMFAGVQVDLEDSAALAAEREKYSEKYKSDAAVRNDYDARAKRYQNAIEAATTNMSALVEQCRSDIKTAGDTTKTLDIQHGLNGACGRLVNLNRYR